MSDKEPKPFNKFLLYLLIILMVVTGSINTIFNKILQKLDTLGQLFEGHHWIITYGMFCGELVSIFFYAYVVIQRKKNLNQQKLIEAQENEEEGETLPQQPSEEEKKIPPVPTNLIFAITAACDLLATTINTFGLTYLTTSMFQMMRGLELFFVCLWSKIFLKNPIYRHAVLGIGSLIFGLGLVGLNAVIFDDKKVAKDPVIGIILLCTSQFFSSTEYVFQEKFIKHYDVHPFQLVGFEGLWGVIMYTVLLVIFQNVSCRGWSESFKKGICSIDDDGNYHIEDTKFALRQMWNRKAILIVYIFYVVSIALYNIVGINLTKLVSSTARAVVDTVRTVFIWLFFLFIHPVDGTEEKFHPLQLVGFLFVVFGALVYNEILVLPFMGLDYYTRDNIALRQKQDKMKDLKDTDEEGRLYVSVDGKDSTANEKEQNNPVTENEGNEQNNPVKEKEENE
jgi:drug/metabolite transporter (DMT)-like permease